MALMLRLARLVRADLHALLDTLETPELRLAQAWRDMEDALERETRRLTELECALARIEARDASRQTWLAQAAVELDDCLAANRDDLARALLRRRLAAERLGERLARSRAVLQSERDTLERQLTDQRAQYDALRAYPRAGPAVAETAPSMLPDDPPIDAAAVEIALLRAKRQREDAR